MTPLLRVLIIEDDEEDAELLRLELESAGRSVYMQRVQTKAAFLAALESEWDIIISDYAMPGFDGLKAFALYRETGIDTPFIFVSGALGEERAVKAMIAGARDYILKGDLGRLNAAVDREVAGAKSRRERREMEAAKASEQRRLALALQATGAGVFELQIPENAQGFDNEQVYCSERLAELLGCSATELRNGDTFRNWLCEHVHPQDLAGLQKCHQNLIEGHEGNNAVEFRLRHPGGGWRNMWCVGEAGRHDSSGRVIDFVGIILDQTERHRMEEQLRQAQKMEAIGLLAGGVAHDFNNLLTVILNFGEFVLESLESDSSASDDMREVLNAARRAEKLTAQLLAFSRRQPVDPEVLNANGLVRDVERMLRRLLGDEIELAVDLAPDLWNVCVDAGCLEQVVVNLAVNARDALPGGGTLKIETRNVRIEQGRNSPETRRIPGGEYVAISVADNGCGMDEEIQRRLFEPFFTTKEAGKGTGLGLATSYGIVQQANGFISVESEVGRGTVFELLLPRDHGSPVDRHKLEAKPERVHGNEVILVVDNEPSVCKLVARVLEHLGYTVLEAASGIEALRIARSSPKPVRLVLTDVLMPKMSGPELVEQLLPLHPEMKVLFMSGHTGTEFAPDNNHALLQKPFSPQALVDKLCDVMDELAADTEVNLEMQFGEAPEP